jgi:GGDEF domain-containing protein
MVDLDEFKAVNDTHGHLAGDELLRLVGARLASAVRPGDVVARFGGDEFAVLLCDLSADTTAGAEPDTWGRAGADGPEVMSPEAVADQVAARIRLALREPYQIAGLAVTVGASVGTAVAPPEGGDVDSLLHAADVAMYRVKADRRSPVVTVDVSSPVIHLNHGHEPEVSLSTAGSVGSG